MVHIVEVHRDGEELAAPMAQIRNWLDNEHIQPTPGGTIFRFKAASEAEAFARAFAGQVIRDERAGSLAA